MGVNDGPADGHVNYPQVANDYVPPAYPGPEANAPPPSGQQQPQPAERAPPQQQPAVGQPVNAPFVHHPQPIPGLPIRPPFATPVPGQQIVGYQVIEPQGGCSCDLKLEGWLVVIILLIIFWPLAWIPCCMPECFQRYQVPVYGAPGQSVPVAAPSAYV